ncbi:MAG: thiamine phosphate synthase [Hyphomicrobiaceae bacterium]|nr:thiamine phosphate synthase [Hyphomicrobiaceae bacterium]
MSKSTHDDVIPCQLYLVIAPGPTARERLAAALDAAPVASVLIKPRAGDKLGAGEVKPLVDLCQKADVAVVLDDDAQLARTLRADGVQVKTTDGSMSAYDEARDILGAGAIVGVDAGGSRHLSMAAGEAGADYVAFGLTDVDRGQMADDTAMARNDLLAWWAEIFEVPCVALDVRDVEDALRVAHTGADFSTFQIPEGMALDDVRAAVADAHDALLRSLADEADA